MARYRVAICRSVYNDIVVEARSEEEARDRACGLFESPDFGYADKFDRMSDDYDAIVVETLEDGK